jgi:hypothetical protein
MKLNEVKDAMQTPEDDEFEKSKKLDTRRPRLTLAHLGKLRKMREIRKLEIKDREDIYKKIYQRPPAM